MDHHLAKAVELGWPLHSHTVSARNELLSQRRERSAAATAETHTFREQQ
jgi:hypothetical protein